VRHLYRSKLLTTILARLGHCETYDFGLELETAIAKALGEVSTTLTLKITKGEGNEVFHLEWENMNKTTTNIHGSNVVNSTAGIMIQEVKSGFSATALLVIRGQAKQSSGDLSRMILGKAGRRMTVAPWSQSGAAHQYSHHPLLISSSLPAKEVMFKKKQTWI